MPQGNPAKRWTTGVDNSRYGSSRNFGQSLVDIFTAKSRFRNQLELNEIAHQQELRHHAETNAVDLAGRTIFEDTQHANRKDLERYRVDQGLRQRFHEKAIDLAHDSRSADELNARNRAAGYENVPIESLGSGKGAQTPSLGNVPAVKTGIKQIGPGAKIPPNNPPAKNPPSKKPRKTSKKRNTPPTKPFTP